MLVVEKADIFAPPYVRSSGFTSSKTWETATFHVRGATFNNSQNGGSDFRFSVNPPELYVRRVTVTRERH
jgi:hypothetical protein